VPPDSGRPSADRGRYDLLSARPLEQLAVLPDESGSHFSSLRAIFAWVRRDLSAGFELPFAGG
jgi:para-aminobenzoate synthetase component 1